MVDRQSKAKYSKNIVFSGKVPVISSTTFQAGPFGSKEVQQLRKGISVCAGGQLCVDKRVQEVKPTQGRLAKEAKETITTSSDW